MEPASGTYSLARRGFALAIGLAYAVAFAVLWQQAPGLIGSDGIRPLDDILRAATERFGATKYLRVPSLFWLHSGDGALRAVAGLGALAGLALAAGLVPRAAAVAAWLAYLSFVSTESFGGTPTFFDWPFDLLTAEVGFLLIFLVPGGWRADFTRESGTARIARWLARLLLFRLVLGPGLSKLAVGQESWAGGEAGRDFLQNAPSPTGLAPAVWDAPMAMHGIATWSILAFELLAPWLFFGPRRWKHGAVALCLLFMALVFATTNVRGIAIYTAALAVLCVDDRAFWQLRLRRRAAAKALPPAPLGTRAFVFAPVALLLAFIGVGRLGSQGSASLDCNRWLPTALRANLDPLRLVNRYELFGFVPRRRIAWVLEGSSDGERWEAFETHTLPCRVDRPAPHMAPWHHYLDFVLWMSAYDGVEHHSHWFLPLARRLLEGSPQVCGLFANVPSHVPPRYLRISRWEYGFATEEQRRRGIYWWREALDEPAHVATLEAGKLKLVAAIERRPRLPHSLAASDE